MRKLLLASFRFKTGETEYEQQRIVLLTGNDLKFYSEKGWTEQEIATEILVNWFKTEFHESELIYAIAHSTIESRITSNDLKKK